MKPLRNNERLSELLTRVQGMRLDAQGLVEGFLSGRHRSPHHGVSIEFSDHKEYAPGDDLRTIDWKVYGRSDKLYIKRFHHETDLTARIILDGSGSMAYGPDDSMKYRCAGVFALALSYLFLRQGDRVEMQVVSDQVQGRVPARPGLGHFASMAKMLETTVPEGETALGPVLDGQVERFGRRRAIIILTDVFEDPERLFRPMRALRARGCSVLLLHVLHGDELDFPFDGVRDFRSMETDGNLVTEPQLIRGLYLKRMQAHLETITTGVQQSNVGYLRIRTGDSLEAPLYELVRRGLP